jgi:hypothetical protein
VAKKILQQEISPKTHKGAKRNKEQETINEHAFLRVLSVFVPSWQKNIATRNIAKKTQRR